MFSNTTVKYVLCYITHVGNLFNVINWSPTPQTFHRHISSPTFVTNIDVTLVSIIKPSLKNRNSLTTGTAVRQFDSNPKSIALAKKTNFVQDFNMLTFWTPGKSSSPKTFFSKISKNSKRLIACNKINHFEKLKKIIHKYFQNPEKNFFI